MKKQLSAFIALPWLLAACQHTNEASTPEVYQANNQTITVYTTAKETTHRLSITDNVIFEEAKQPSENENSIFVNPNKTFQTFMGIGGAITDASAEVFAKIPANKQQELLDAYYDPDKGIGYTLARATIHSSDFGSYSHTYIEEGDDDLSTFSIEHDKKWRIPLIKRAINAAGGELTLYVSPWSAPAFMKGKENMLGGGKLLPKYYNAWAMYYAKFIKAYEQEGMPIWGLTIQNEPMAVQRWESMVYTAQEERDFLKNHLGPTLASEGLGDKNIIVWDHNKDLITHRANTIFDDPEAAKYAWGIGFHWYETWRGGEPKHDNLDNILQSYPDMKLIFTEGTNENFDANKYQYWPNAERYGYEMIRDFNRGTVAWTDWNILLDHKGGPNHVQNYCFAPIHADTNTGELIYTPTYYYIGHFSKFIRKGARRISTSTSISFLLSTTFQNTDNSMATVVMNQSDTDLEYNFLVGDKQTKLTIPARAMQTLVY
jgi:glucosylceramidase